MINHSGIGTYIRNILMRWPKSNYRISAIIPPNAIAQYPFLERFELIDSEAAIYSVKEQLKLPFLIPSCDLLWSMHYNVPLAPIRAKKRLVTIHDVNHLALSSNFSFAQFLYAKFMLNQAARRSEKILTISHFSAREIEQFLHVPKSKITPIHLGVDRSHFYPRRDQEALQKIRQKYSLPDKFLLFVSNLAPHKNIRGLLLAWEKVIRELKDWELVIVGKPTKQNNWKSLPTEKVVFLGGVDYNDLPLLYESAYASILPSFYEGFGLTPLEAMSCGCPGIVSNIASLPEVFESDCLYFNPHDPEDIATTMMKLMRDPTLRQQLSETGLVRADCFSWDKTTKTHVELVEAML